MRKTALARVVSSSAEGKGSLAYWVISTGLLLWGVVYAGLVVFTFVVATPEDLIALADDGQIKPEYVEYIGQIPHWAIAATAIVAATRLLGGIGLIMRRAWAVPLYAVSFAFFIIIFVRAFVFADITNVIRESQVAVELLFVVLSAFAVWFARKMRSDGVIR